MEHILIPSPALCTFAPRSPRLARLRLCHSSHTHFLFFFCTAGAELTGRSNGSKAVIFRPGWRQWAASSAVCAARWRGWLFTYSENPQGPRCRSLKVTRTPLDTPWLSIRLSALVTPMRHQSLAGALLPSLIDNADQRR